MSEQKQEQADRFKAIFYTPVSFVLLLIAGTFPQDPTVENIAIANLWLSLLFDVLPIENVLFTTYLKDLNFDAEQQPLKTRKDFMEFVFAMHEKVLGEKLNKKHTLQLLEQLGANDCNSNNPQKGEASCIRTTQQIPFACVVMVRSSKTTSSFWMDEDLLPQETIADEELLWSHAMQSAAAFCSCVFSAKWFVLHMVASGFPSVPSSSDRYKYHTFLTLFGKLLACFACRVNFQSNMELVQYNPQTDLLSNSAFVAFMHRLHDTVNAMLGKPVGSVSLEETTQFFHVLAKADDTHFCSIMIAKEKDALGRFYFQ